MGAYLRLFIKQQKKYILTAFMLIVVSASLVARRAFSYGTVFQSLVTNAKSGQKNLFFTAVVWLVVIELSVYIIKTLSDNISTRYRGYMNLNIRLFGVDKVVEMNYQNAAKLGSGKLLQIIHSGMESYSFLIYDGIKAITEVMIMLGVIVTILSVQSLRFLVIFVAIIIITIGLQKVIFTHLKSARDRDVVLNESYTKQTAKILMNFILLKIYNIKDQELATLREIGTARVNNYQWIKFWFRGITSTTSLLFTMMMMVAIWYLGTQYAAGIVDEKIFFVIALLFNQVRTQLYNFGNFIAELSEKLTYIQRFDEIVGQSQQSLQSENTKETVTGPLVGDVCYDHISFQYEGSPELLFEDLSLTIPSGQKLAIIGKSGSGKSTLFKLLTKMLEPSEGDIMLGKESLQTISVDRLYHHIGYFYQEPLVFDASIRENITLNAPLDEEKITNALKLCHLDHLSPDTIIGEHGVLLSGGEKQRLALARAFVFDYDILLLDEPTSNLDPQLEQELLLAIFDHYKNKTIIVISHRPFILDFVDRVLILKKGIVVSDSHRNETKNLK